MRFPEIQIGLLALTLSASAPSQCSYPAMPRGGFALTEILDTELTYRDGARTKVDVCYPSTPASCGWPVVFWMHGMTAERTHILSAVRTMARRGFAVVSFDVRGHGDAARMNGARFGFELVGRDERLDIVEIVEHLRARHGGKVDVSRLGMYGYSQGAMYAWAAAAWSGRPLPTNPRGLTTFPTFKAICPLWWAPLTGDVMVPRGKGFTGRLFSALYEFVQDKKITPGSSWYSKIDGMIRSQDFAGVKALFDNDPFRQELNLLRTCTVPVFTQVSWNDDWVPLSATLDAFAALPASTPRRGFLTFPGHDGPRSVKPMQGEMTKLMAARWLNRFLKEIRNDVENESLYITGAVNQTSKEFLNLEPVWNRYRPAWPPAHQQTQTWYLRSRGVLSTSPPTTAEAREWVHHKIPPGYDVDAFIKDQGNPGATLLRLNLDKVDYDTAPLDTDFEIVGATEVVVEANPTGKNYQLHCALYRVEPDDTELFLGSGVALMRETTVHPARLKVTMNHVDALIRRGQRLRLRLENIAFRPVVDANSLLVAPYFESVDVQIVHEKTASGDRVSSITVPFEPGIQPALVTSHLELDVLRNPIDRVFYLIKAPTYPPTTPYVLVFGATGMNPGFRWAGRNVHMNWDPALSSQLLGFVNTQLFPHTLGILGRQETQLPALALQSVAPIPPAAIGIRLLAVGALSDGATTNPVELYYR